MSSPIHHAKDLDAALMYAPPWVRRSATGAPVKAIAPGPDGSRWNWLVDNANDDGFSGDRAMSDLRRRLALSPHRVPEPPMENTPAQWPFVLRLCAVSSVAAIAAWGVVSMAGMKNDLPATVAVAVPPQTVQASEPQPIAANPVRVVHVQIAAGLAPVVEEAFATRNDPQSLPETVATPVPQLPSPPPPANSAPAIGADEIATLVKRGKDLLLNGDFASARLLLRRATEAGSADAALALGATFDPAVLAKLGAIGAAPDIDKARQWYQKAADLGSNDAPQQLAKLAQAHQ
jgi:hypothetical protein